VRKAILGLICGVLLVAAGCGDADAAERPWYIDWVGKLELKAGTLAHWNDNAEEEDGPWSPCVSTELLQWRKFQFDGGVSEDGTIFLDGVYHVNTLNDIVKLGDWAKHISLNAGVFIGRNLDATDDGVEAKDDWAAGFVLYLVDLDLDTEWNHDY